MSKPLSYFADIHYGKSPADVIAEDGEVPVYGTGGVYGKASTSLFSGPAVIIPRKGSLSSPHFSEGPCWASDTTYAAIPRRGVDAQWLYYQLCQFNLESLNEATGVPSISRDWLAKSGLFPHDTDSQTTIARVLRGLDTQIEATEALIAKQERVRAGLTHDLFTRGIDEHGQLRPPREQAPHLYRQTELGWVPKGWNVSPLRKLVPRAIYGISDSLSDDPSGVPILRMNNIQVGKIDVAELKFSSKILPSNLFLRPGDVLFNRTNSMEHVGKTAIWNGEIEMASFASYLVRLEPDTAHLKAHFLCYWLNRPHVQIIIRRYATPGVHQVNINPTNLRRISCAHPLDTTEQLEITKLIARSDVIIETNVAMAKMLRLQKSGLMQDLLTDKVSVAPLLEGVAA